MGSGRCGARRPTARSADADVITRGGGQSRHKMK